MSFRFYTASSRSVLFYKTYFSIVTNFAEFAEFSEGLELIFWEAGIGKTVGKHVNCWVDWTLRFVDYWCESLESLESSAWRAFTVVSAFNPGLQIETNLA